MMKKENQEYYSVVYSDPYIVVVNKPAGLMVERDKHGNPNLEDVLAQEFPPRNAFTSEVQPIHRIDRPVSGLVVFGRTPMAVKHLNEQFEKRNVKKVYWAIVQGNTPKEETLKNYIFKDNANKKAVVNKYKLKDHKEAELSYTEKKTFPKNTMIEVVLKTGRFHQIRAQLGFAGYPIVGDKLYSRSSAATGNEILLHSRSITFTHPKTLETMTFEAPLHKKSGWETFIEVEKWDK